MIDSDGQLPGLGLCAGKCRVNRQRKRSSLFAVMEDRRSFVARVPEAEVGIVRGSEKHEIPGHRLRRRGLRSASNRGSGAVGAQQDVVHGGEEAKSASSIWPSQADVGPHLTAVPGTKRVRRYRSTRTLQSTGPRMYG